ncbi:ABC transporter ATP-binding protein [soil metagenome]
MSSSQQSDHIEVPAPVVLQMHDATRIHGSGSTAVTAVDHVDLAVHAGELVAVMGRSGSGKSTLLNLAGGLDAPSRGTVRVEGTDLSALSPRDLAAIRRRHVGYVFQHGNLLPTLTAAENVSLPLELDGVSLREARASAIAILSEVLHPEVADRYPDQLSGGEQQRVAVARGLVGGRRLLLADEPTGALDEVTAEKVMRLLRDRCDAGAAALVVTHDAAQAAWADRVVRLRDGRIDSIIGGLQGDVASEVTR